MIDLSESILEEIRGHAASLYPRECCGLVVVFKGRHKYIPCRNIAESNNDFLLHPEDFASAEDMGEIVLIVHSHCNIPAIPSQADLVSCENTQIPWLIVNWPTGNTYQFEPTGYKAPLIGRSFSHGILDCFSIIRDYYKETLGIDLEDPSRGHEWWKKGQNLYLDNAEKWGFERVSTLNTHDVILFTQSSTVPNHGAIWLGGGNILHHQTNRLSSRDVYGGWYRKNTTHFFRHRSLIK